MELGAGQIALDIGGGRGQHARVWLENKACPVVIDPALGMAQAAATVPGVTAVRGRAQAIPLVEASARLAYFHLSIHYGDWQQALREVRRVVAPGGQCWIWTMGERHHRESFLARWFPSVGDIDAARFPDPAEVATYLAEMGARVEMGQEIEDRTRPAGDWRAAAAARFVSTLQLVPPEEFANGLGAFDATYPDPAELVQYRLTFDRICARM